MSQVEQQIDVARSTLGGALRTGPLSIPNYQREYAWKVDRVRKLFDDFNSAMVKRQPTYFLGTVVTTPGRPPKVIDGQQRLATTMIFLAAARDALLDLGRTDDAKSIEDDFLFAWDRTAGEHVPRLSLNTDDRAYMQSRVLARPGDRKGARARLHSHRRIDDAAIAASDRVGHILRSADSVQRKVEALNAWIDFIDKAAVVVMLQPPNPARAYQMFKTLNDRAQRTTQADMIKNHLFEHAADGVDEAQSKWSSMRTTIEGMEQAQGDDPLLVYLHHVSIVFNGPIQADDIFEMMESNIASRGQALGFLEALANYASDYAAIVTPSHAKWGPYDQRVRTYITHIAHDIKVTFIRPLMLAIAGKFAPSEALAAYQACVNWVVRFLISGGHRSGAVEKAIGEAAHGITIGRIDTAGALIDAMESVVPDDRRFHAAFCDKTIATARQARFILGELERQIRTGTPGDVVQPLQDVQQISLEHILPKNLEAKRGWDHFAKDAKRAYRNRLGNMVLLKTKDNGAVGDKSFAEKRGALEKSSHLRLTADVLERVGIDSLWTTDHIDTRQRMMADLAIRRWPVRP